MKKTVDWVMALFGAGCIAVGVYGLVRMITAPSQDSIDTVAQLKAMDRQLDQISRTMTEWALRDMQRLDSEIEEHKVAIAKLNEEASERQAHVFVVPGPAPSRSINWGGTNASIPFIDFQLLAPLVEDRVIEFGTTPPSSTPIREKFPAPVVATNLYNFGYPNGRMEDVKWNPAEFDWRAWWLNALKNEGRPISDATWMKIPGITITNLEVSP